MPPVSRYNGSNDSIKSRLTDSGAADDMAPYRSNFAKYGTLGNSNNWVILCNNGTNLETLRKSTIPRWVDTGSTPHPASIANHI